MLACKKSGVIKVSLDYSFPIQPNDSAETKDFTQLEAERAYSDLVALQRAAMRQLL